MRDDAWNAQDGGKNATVQPHAMPLWCKQHQCEQRVEIHFEVQRPAWDQQWRQLTGVAGVGVWDEQ